MLDKSLGKISNIRIVDGVVLGDFKNALFEYAGIELLLPVGCAFVDSENEYTALLVFQTDNFKSAQALVFTNRIPSNDGLELFNPKNPNVNIILTDDVKVSTDFIAEKITTSGGADLDSVKSVLQNFINFFNAHVHPSNGAPPLPPGFVPSWGASKSRVEEVDDEQ